ncbi:MAG: DUF721 domain-containing protein [Candidatus Brocadiae bacterium]|nr:DUF721 domain-containing protein [Candidatus Brocadiia bacterium]
METKSREPEILKDVIKKWLKRTGLDSWKRYSAFSIWNQAIQEDENLVKHTFPNRFSASILEIIVDSPVYYYELIHFHRANLLKKIQEIGEEKIYIKDIRFIFKDPDKKTQKLDIDKTIRSFIF